MSIRVTAPTRDPNSVYPQLPGIHYPDFVVGSEGLTEEQKQIALDQFYAYENGQIANFLGYSGNRKLNYKDDLAGCLNLSMNNAGDAFASGSSTTTTKFVERAVLDYFASLWNAQWPHLSGPVEGIDGQEPEDWKESYWGYILSMGSTEGNLYALWNARDYLSGKALYYDTETDQRMKKASKGGKSAPRLPRVKSYRAKATKENPNMYTPIAFYSQDTHYSVIKSMRIFEVADFYSAGSGKFACPLCYPEDYPEGFDQNYLDENNWPYEVPSNADGTVYIPALVKLVECFAAMGHPIYVNFTYGTTFKGACDQVEKAVAALVPVLKRYGLYEREVIYDEEQGLSDIRNGFWFHVDGAFGAAYMPFVEMLEENEDFPVFDFRIKEIHSIIMSGHKWIGAPWPCGIFMSKTKYQMMPPDNPNYIGAPDTTFAGSRNAFSPLIFWHYLATHSYEDSKQIVADCIELTDYAYEQLQELETLRGEDLWVERSSGTLTIRFRKANPDISFKYSLASEELYVDGEQRSYSHIYIVEHVTKEMLDRLIEDLQAEDAFIEQ